MPNEVKYQNQVWGEPIAGERLSTNGHYTGEHLGVPMQDLAYAQENEEPIPPHYVETNTIRYGTVTQDALGNPSRLNDPSAPM